MMSSFDSILDHERPALLIGNGINRHNSNSKLANYGRIVHKSISLQLETCPINGRIVLRIPREDASEAYIKKCAY